MSVRVECNGETTLSKIFSYARKSIRAEIPPVLSCVFRPLVFIFNELSFPRRDRSALSPRVNILAGEKRGILACFSRFALFWRIAGPHELAERPVYVPPRFQLHSLVRACSGDIDRFVHVVCGIASVYSLRMLEWGYSFVRAGFICLRNSC